MLPKKNRIANKQSYPENLLIASQLGIEYEYCIQKMLDNLTDLQLRVVEYYYDKFLTDRQIGEILGISSARVNQIRHAALRSMRKTIGITLIDLEISRSHA